MLIHPSPLFGRNSRQSLPPPQQYYLYSAGVGPFIAQGESTLESQTFQPVLDYMFTSPPRKLFSSRAVGNGRAVICLDDEGVAYAAGRSKGNLRIAVGSEFSYTFVRATPDRINIPAGGWVDVSISALDSVTGGSGAGLGISGDGKLYAWGSIFNGGSSSGASYALPTQILGGVGWTKCAAGTVHYAGIRSGQVFTWGFRLHGCLGDGQNSSGVANSAARGGFTNATDVACGNFSTMVIDSGRLYFTGKAWNSRGGISTDRTTFIEVGGGEGWTKISCGTNYSLGIRNNALMAVGSGNAFQLGTGSTSQVNTWTVVDDSGIWTDVCCGTGTTGYTADPTASVSPSAGIKDGKLYVWGLNNQYQCGLGHTDNVPIPTQIGEDDDWIAVTVTNDGIMALKASPMSD